MGEQVAVEKENVLIRAGDCAVSLLPHFGAKIASIQMRGRELLQAPLAPYADRTHSMPFDQSDASGWDECLPSVAACTVQTEGGAASVPDHGDMWRVDWERVATTGDSITLRGPCFSLPLALERTVTVQGIQSGARIEAAYTVSNTGSGPAPWSWAAHPLFAAEAGDRVVLPTSINALRLEGSGGGRLGKGGYQVDWPIAMLADGSSTDLSVAQGAESEIGDKLFAGPLTENENWCALERRQAGIRIKIGFNPEATPYLGLWICYGGWPERPGPKQMCVALEPTTAPVDSLAQLGPWSRTLEAGASFSWSMTIEIETL
jgi:galactose mutarotase-like enzyme